MNEKNYGKICKFEGCIKPAIAKGLCSNHYNDIKYLHVSKRKKCLNIGCDNNCQANEVCFKCQLKLRYYGNKNLPPQNYINSCDACKMLNISRQALNQLCKRKKINKLKLNKRVCYYSLIDVCNYLEYKAK